MNILVSSCLLGLQCKYSGGSNANKVLIEAVKESLQPGGKLHFIPVCPECYGGLPIPRLPGEQRQGRVYSKNGDDVTEQYRRGSEATLQLAKLFDCQYAILKQRSPSCGSGQIYDGTFTGTVVEGDGTAVKLLKQAGVMVVGEENAEKLLKLLKEE